MEYIISIDRIRAEESVQIEETFSPEFMDIAESDLSFTSPIKVDLTLSLGGDFVLISGNITTEATSRCTICNELFSLPISIDFHWASEEDLPQEFDLLPMLREQILIEVPPFAECSNGVCPERKSIQNYFAKPETPASPFSGLDIEF